MKSKFVYALIVAAFMAAAACTSKPAETTEEEGTDTEEMAPATDTTEMESDTVAADTTSM